MFDDRQGSGSDAGNSPKNHRKDESAGKHPEGTASKADRPETDRHHDEQVIKAGEGMEETGLGSTRGVHRMIGLRMGHCGKSRRKENEEREVTFHPVCLTAASVAGRAENQYVAPRRTFP